MPEIVPSAKQMTTLVGKPLYEARTQLCALIDEKYDMERLWGSGGLYWAYWHKFRPGGKMLGSIFFQVFHICFLLPFREFLPLEFFYYKAF